MTGTVSRMALSSGCMALPLLDVVQALYLPVHVQHLAPVDRHVTATSCRDVGEVTKCVLMIAARSQDPAKWPTYAPFHVSGI